MLEKIKSMYPPFKWALGLVVSALVLIWFWHPVWGFIGAIAAKADKLFP